MRKLYTILIIVLAAKITFGQNSTFDNSSVWECLNSSLKNIHISICDTVDETEFKSAFLANYLTTDISSSKKFFFLKVDSLEYTVDSIRDTVSVVNNFDIIFFDSDLFRIGFILHYSLDENFNNFGAFLLDRILLHEKESDDRYIIAIDSLFETEYIVPEELFTPDSPPPSPFDVTIIDFKTNPNLKSTNVYSIVKVNSKLEPINRLDFCKGRLISFSEIDFMEPNSELIQIYSCRETEKLETISFFQLKRLMQYGTQIETDCMVRIKRTFENIKPYWITLSYNYN